MFWNIDRKCPFTKCSRCTACNVLSIECDGRNYVFCEQFRIVMSVKEQEAQDENRTERPVLQKLRIGGEMGMTENELREKVIKGLECCIDYDYKCNNCPYQDDGGAEDGCYSDELKANVLALLKGQEPRVMTLRELDFYDAGIFVETRNGCPEGLTDELWPALVHLYCVSQNDEYGYVSFINWNADTYDFEAKDYNVEFRCWTSRPTDAQREKVKWE